MGEYKRYTLLVQLETKQKKVEQQQEAKSIVESHRQEVIRIAAQSKLRRQKAAAEATPGPGEYDIFRGEKVLSEFPSAPVPALPVGERFREGMDDLPGPGAYEKVDENLVKPAKPVHAVPKARRFSYDVDLLEDAELFKAFGADGEGMGMSGNAGALPPLPTKGSVSGWG